MQIGCPARGTGSTFFLTFGKLKKKKKGINLFIPYFDITSMFLNFQYLLSPLDNSKINSPAQLSIIDSKGNFYILLKQKPYIT